MEAINAVRRIIARVARPMPRKKHHLCTYKLLNKSVAGSQGPRAEGPAAAVAEEYRL